MAAVMVNIAGRAYRLSCNDGEEARLEQLARYVESKILSMQDSFKEIGEQRIVVMAALAIADESSDARGRAEALGLDVVALRGELEAARKTIASLEERVSEAVEDAAKRIEQLSADLQKPAPRDDFPL
jgi:cell division protein ZapA